MYGFPRPLIPNDVQWNRHRAPCSPQWRQFNRPRAPFRPRNQDFIRPPMYGGSEEYWCETCDRGFPNEDLLNKHKQQHQKCNIDGCQFIAHPKVITKHIQMQHSSGLYKKIAKLNNPEEIEKWREERKKKYPTKTNIDKKAAELKEKVDRGEKMNLGRKDWHSKRNEKYQNRDNNSGQGMKRTYNNANSYQPTPKFRKTRKQAPKVLPAPEDNRSLVPFAGIQYLEMESDEEVDEGLNCDDLIKDDDIEKIENDLGATKNHKSIIVEKPVVCSALSSLMCEYGSSDEEIDEIETSQHFKDKEIQKVEIIGKSQIKVTEQGISQQTSNKDSKNLPEEDNNTKKIGKNIDIEKKLPQLNNATGIGAESYEVLTTNPSNVCLEKNNVLYVKEKSSDSRPQVKVHEIKSVTSKPDELAIGNNSKLDSSEKKEGNNDQDDNDSGPEEVKVYRNDDSGKENNTVNFPQENKADNKIVKKKVEVVRRKPVYKKPKPKLPSTLIYRLLSKEMKRERNQVLQCIRYIRKNNYFDKNSP